MQGLWNRKDAHDTWAPTRQWTGRKNKSHFGRTAEGFYQRGTT
ncbi:unnamed protein product [Taenia asiatica]|uniref:Myelin basic protein n=1 Tax=Taenia asiatica TaxID=60517 RepID=A0A0R3WC57_TAEAS|nr:unnamed protein product [Taenia asiatica]